MTSVWVSPFCCRGAVSSFCFQRKANPGLAIAAAEILGSVRTHPERCASPPAVFHSPAPRPNWASAGAAQRSAPPVIVARRAVCRRIRELLLLTERLRDRLLGDGG